MGVCEWAIVDAKSEKNKKNLLVGQAATLPVCSYAIRDTQYDSRIRVYLR
jgi:hypothetical protein